MNDGKINVNSKYRIIYIIQLQFILYNQYIYNYNSYFIKIIYFTWQKNYISPSKIISLIHEFLHFVPRHFIYPRIPVINPFTNAIVLCSFISWMSVKCLISPCYTNVLCSNPGSASRLLWSTRWQRNCDRAISAGYAFIVLCLRCEWKNAWENAANAKLYNKAGFELLSYHRRWNRDFDATDTRK